MEEKILIKGLSPRTTQTHEFIDDDGDKKVQTITELPEDFLVCVKCGQNAILEACKNCNHYPIYHIYSNSSFYQLTPCEKCGLPHHQNRWKCKNCDCDNPLNTTLFHCKLIQTLEKEGTINEHVKIFIFSFIVCVVTLILTVNNNNSIIIGLICPLMFLGSLISTIVNLVFILKRS